MGAGVITQGVFGHYLVITLAQQQADSWAVLWVLTLAPSALLCLPGQNIVINLPLEQHQYAVHRQRVALLEPMEATFELVSQLL